MYIVLTEFSLLESLSSLADDSRMERPSFVNHATERRQPRLWPVAQLAREFRGEAAALCHERFHESSRRSLNWQGAPGAAARASRLFHGIVA